MRAGAGQPRHGFIAHGKQIVDVLPQIRKRRPVLLDDIPERREAGRRIQRIVVGDVGRHELVKLVIPRAVPDIFDEST
jgi:hypothetical protein